MDGPPQPKVHLAVCPAHAAILDHLGVTRLNPDDAVDGAGG